jgi:hypothetical protein
MSQAAVTSASLGDFDVTSTINYIDNRVRSELFSERISTDNLGQTDISLKADASSNPIDFKKAYVRIVGNVTGSDNGKIAAMKANVVITPFAFFNMFDSATLKLNGQIIETITDFAMAEQILAIMSRSSYELNNGTIEEGSAFTIPLDTNQVTAAVGTYSVAARSHLVGALSSTHAPFEMTFNLSDLFLSIRTMQAVYKRMNIEVIFKRKPSNLETVTGIRTTDAAGTTLATLAGTEAAQNDTADTKFVLTQVSLVYSEYVLANTIEDDNNKQYEQDHIALPYLSMQCALEPIQSSIFSKQLGLTTSKFGNECLMIAFTDKDQNKKKSQPLLLKELDLTKLEIKIGGNKLFDANDLSEGYKRLYEKFRMAKNLFISDQSQAISHYQWLKQYPILAFDLNSFANTDKLSGIQNISVYLERSVSTELNMYIYLVSDQAKAIKPSTMTVVGDLNEKQ